MRVQLSEALAQMKDELRQAILDTSKDIIFVPKDVELELMVSFDVEAKAGGGVKLLTFLTATGEVSQTQSDQHKLTLKFDITDASGKPLLVRDTDPPKM